jgi:hypothetical protein
MLHLPKIFTAVVSRPRTQIDRRSPFPLSLGLCLGVLRGEISLCDGQCDQLPQPAIGHRDVVIEQTRYSPRAALSPWLIAAGSPRLVASAMTVTGTGAASCTLARYADVSSVEPSSSTISSQDGLEPSHGSTHCE